MPPEDYDQKQASIDQAVQIEVNRNPLMARDKVLQMILDQTIDSRLLAAYVYYLAYRPEIQVDSQDNQNFWNEIEQNFV